MDGKKPFSALDEPERRSIGRRIIPFKKPQKKKRVFSVNEHVLALLGLSSISYGAWMMYHPLGPIVAGLFLVGVAVLISLERDEPRS